MKFSALSGRHIFLEEKNPCLNCIPDQTLPVSGLEATLIPTIENPTKPLQCLNREAHIVLQLWQHKFSYQQVIQVSKDGHPRILNNPKTGAKNFVKI